MDLRTFTLTWSPLESSVFTAAAYLPAEHLLYLRFRSGDVYRYFDVPPEHYRDLLAAESHGQYFAYKIRDRFRCEEVSRSLAAGD